MIKNIILFIIFFLFLVIFQTSFLIPFSVLGKIPNLGLVFLFLVLFFNKNSFKSFPVESIIAGILLDVFYGGFLGLSGIILFLISLLFQWIFENVRKQNILVFGFLLFFFLTFYQGLFLLANFLIEKNFVFSNSYFWVQILYNFIVGYLLLICLNLKSLKTLRKER